jgi:AcrR family transcriptional regulator
MPRSATLSRRQREKEERKDQILAAARHVFFTQGIHRATVEAVAEQAAVAKGTVYLYFRTKETILAHLLLEGLESLNARLLAAHAGPAGASAHDRLRRLALAYYTFHVDEPDYFRLMMAFDRGQFEEAIRPELYAQIRLCSLQGLSLVIETVQAGITAGELVAGDARQLAGMLWAAINGVLVLTGHPLRRELLQHQVEQLYDGVLDTMLRGMRAQAPA